MRSAANRIMFLAWTVAALIGISAFSACGKSQQDQALPTAGSAVKAPAVKGKAFEYQVGDYRLRLTFLEEKTVHWEYLAAPGGLTGKNATETIDSIPIRDDVLMVAWKEADGTQVLDVLDLGRMVIYPNFVTANGERNSSHADMRQVQ
ncbi:MAG: MoaF-related domain-containing protein [Pseudonocardiaceae bacterium]